MKTFLTLITTLLAALPAYTQQWAPSGGPEGGDVVSLAVRGETLLALLSPGGVYRHDGRWSRLATLDAQEIHATDSALFAAGIDGIFRSLDMGESWERIGPAGRWFRLSVDGENLYAAADSTIYRSTDNGTSWLSVASPGRYFYSFFVYDSIMLIGRAGDMTGLYRSGDSGESWSRVDAGLPADFTPQAFHRIGSALYIGSDMRGVYRSTDGGLSWSSFNNGLPRNGGAYPLVSSFASLGGRIWIAGRDGTYEHDGTEWRVVGMERDRVLAAGEGALYLGSINGVMRTADTGRTWTSMNRGLNAHRVTAIAPFGGTTLAGAAGSIFRSRDRGASWTRVTAISVSRFFNGGDVVYALGRSQFEQGLFKSVDGLDWGRVGKDLPVEGRSIRAVAAHGNRVFAGVHRITFGEGGSEVWLNGGIYRSNDRGATWEPASTGLPEMDGVHVPVVDMIDIAGTLLAETLAGVYRSTDGGTTWARVAFPEKGPLMRFARVGEKVFLLGHARAFVSSDRGLTWSEISDGIPVTAGMNQVSALRGAVYFSAVVDGDPGRVYRLGEDQSRWVDVTGWFPGEIDVTMLVEAEGRVLAGTAWNSVWSGSLDPVSDLPSTGAGIAPLLLTSAPNPFRSTATIGFTIESRGDLRLTLADQLGREIATLYQGVLEEGEHEVRFDGSGLAAGVYHLRLVKGERVVTKKVIKGVR